MNDLTAQERGFDPHTALSLHLFPSHIDKSFRLLTLHSHANAHCIMKMLKGSLKETRYQWPTVHLNNKEDRPLQIENETLYLENEVTYMSDKLGLHKISNPDPVNFAVSLHCKRDIKMFSCMF